MPNTLGMSFDACVTRFAQEPGIVDPRAFCGSLEKLIGFGKKVSLSVAQVKALCPGCSDAMGMYGIKTLKLGGDRPMPVELKKSLDRLVGKFHVKLPIRRIKRAEGLVTGWASISTATDGSPVIDFDGDIIPVEELEKAAQRAFSEAGGKGKAGDMHEITGVADIVESMVMTRDKREALGFGEGPEGWAVTLKIHDPELLKQIKDGTKAELSIRFNAKRFRVKGASADIGVLKDLVLNKVELLSIVDEGASGDARHRPAIVLIKRKQMDDEKQETDITADTELGDFIRAQLDEREMTIDELASATGIPMGTLSQIVDGQIKDPPAERISAIAEAIGVTVSELNSKVPKDLRGGGPGGREDAPKGWRKRLAQIFGTAQAGEHKLQEISVSKRKQTSAVRKMLDRILKKDSLKKAGAAIKQAMDDQGVTVADLSAVTEIVEEELEAIVEEALAPTTDQLETIAEALETTAEALGNGGEKQEPDEGLAHSLDEVLGMLTEEQRAVIMAALESAATAKGEHTDDEDEEEEKKRMARERAQLPIEVRKQLREGDELRKRVSLLEDREEDTKYSKLAAEIPYLPGLKQSEMADVLKSASRSMSKKANANLIAVLKSANEAIELGDTFGEIGSVLDSAGTPQGDMEALAVNLAKSDTELLKIADPKLRIAKARIKAMRENPELSKRATEGAH